MQTLLKTPERESKKGERKTETLLEEILKAPLQNDAPPKPESASEAGSLEIHLQERRLGFSKPGAGQLLIRRQWPSEEAHSASRFASSPSYLLPPAREDPFS